MNSSLNGEVSPIRLVPSVSYKKGLSQFELGIGLNPFTREEQKLLSVEVNYKYYPNGTVNKFNLYFISHFSYINNTRETYYPTTYNYLFLNGGYGLEISTVKDVYLGTNISIGAFSYSKTSENPYLDFATSNMLDEVGFTLAFQFNIGYRF